MHIDPGAYHLINLDSTHREEGMHKNIVLIGLSGTGKSTVGAMLAQTLRWNFWDTDVLIEREAGRPVSTIFAEEGEPAFRVLEAAALRKAMADAPAVIATGGGIVETISNHEALRDALVVWLTARPQTLVERLATHHDRPLLQGSRQEALQAQLERRAARYAGLADWIVPTDTFSPEQVTLEIQRGIRHGTPDQTSLRVQTPGGDYEVLVGAGMLERLPREIKRVAPRGRAWIVSDDQVWPLHGGRLADLLAEAAHEPRVFQIPAGESSKHLSIVSGVYDWLLGAGVERGDLLIAVGGGVVGDLTGFVASTILRGIGLIHLPTTVLAVVDSSIGGKTGVDHAVGKNLIGTFYQPRLVLADTTLLHTLPQAERQAGWAEAIKHGVIADQALFDDLAAAHVRVRALEEPVTGDLLRRAAAVKVGIVSGDEREQGARILLNYGHTVGHALEQLSNYTIRHGECVAIGMGVAAAIARRIGLCGTDVEQQQEQILQAFGLPTLLPAETDPQRLLEATRSDKKVRHQKQRWVLPTRVGAATVRDDVDEQIVLEAIQERRAR
jgi:shikimate kinase / 3-dehydroquinate synthase